MLSAVCVGTDDLEKAGQFYDEVFVTIGLKRLVSADNEIGYGHEADNVSFWVLRPFNGKNATFGNGTQIMFSASDKGAIVAFHEAAIRLGGTNEGDPGPRDYSPDYYGAYVRDLDGNKLYVFLEPPNSRG